MKYFLLIGLFLFLQLDAYERVNRLEKVSLQLHWKYQFQYAGFIAAKEKGFYKDVGLDVALLEYKIGDDVEKMVLDGDVTYGIYNSSTLIDYLNGKPIVLVASFFKRSALVLVTQPDIHTPKDLKHKKVMGSTFEDLELNFMPYFHKYNLKLSDITLVKHTYRLDEFINKEVDAMTAFRSDQLPKLDKLGIKYNVLDPSDENLYVLQEELFTSQKEVQKHPHRVAKFRQASIRGWQYALEHQEEIIDIIHKKYAPHLSKDELRAEARAIERLILPYTYDIGSIDKNFLNKQLTYFKDFYHIKTNKTLDGFIFDMHKSKTQILFTPKEKEYLQKYHTVPVCVHYDFFPIDGMKNGKMIGFMEDVYKIIEQKTSLHFQPVPSSFDGEWLYNLRRNRCKVVPVISSYNIQYAPLNTTSPITQTHFTLISTLDKSFVYEPSELYNKKILVQKTSYKNYLLRLYPSLYIEVQKDKNSMIQTLLQNHAYGIVTLDEQADYIIDEYGYGKLKINGFLAKENPLQISLGVTRDDKTLLHILEKTLQSIPYEQLQKIENSWRLSRYQRDTDYSLALKILFGMGALFLIMIYYQKKLKSFNKELENLVHQKTKELREVNESLEATVQEKIQELIQKDEILTLQSKQAVMGEMLSMIAHQWRQPLNTITLQISQLELQEMMGQSVEKKELIKMLDQISKTIVYLSETIDDFKTYFNPNKHASTIEIDALIERAVNFLKPRLKRANIQLDVQVKQHFEVQTYINEFTQVLLNILNNAIDAYEALESSNSEKRISIVVTKQEKDFEVMIIDSAGGIAKEHIKQIFDPYFSTKGKNGTGLGLYMSKMIIEKQFNGEIDVDSYQNQTRFTIRVPLNLT